MTTEFITTPASAIENSIAMVVLAARLHDAANENLLPKSFGAHNIRVDTGGVGLTIQGEAYSKEKLEGVSFNLLLCAIGQAAIATERLLIAIAERKTLRVAITSVR